MKARVHLLFKTPQVWWAYLAVISNSAILAGTENCADLVCYDHEQDPREAQVASASTTKYVRIFWDGITNCGELEECFAKSPAGRATSVFTIGINHCAGPASAGVQPLYAQGELHFLPASVRFAAASLLRVQLARWKSLAVPVKNFLRRTGSKTEALQLFAGKSRVVFCGSFGLHPKVVSMLATRYGVASPEVLERQWCSERHAESKDEYLQAYLQDLSFLAQLHDAQDVSELFFVACVRLLDREYLIRHLEWTGVPTYTSQFGSSYIDVYSTPFYRQHLFLDFGSTVGTGNYPRSVDLAYYAKTVLAIVLSADAAELLQGIRLQTHEPQMALRWQELSLKVSRLR